ILFTHPVTTVTHSLSLHDALPISRTGAVLPRVSKIASATIPVVTARRNLRWRAENRGSGTERNSFDGPVGAPTWSKSDISTSKRSEEHTSELQSLTNLVSRLLLEK